MRINTNVSAINAHKNLTQTQSALGSSMQKLSSGFRINRAADDAAGLGIANALRATTRSLVQASRNAEQANSLLQIAEGGTGTIQKMLERMKELASQAASDTVDNAGRLQLQKEFDALVDEIDRTVDTTKFQGTRLLDGQTPTFKFMVSSSGEYGGQDAVSVSLTGVRSDSLGETGSTLDTLKTSLPTVTTAASVFTADNLTAGSSNNAGSLAQNATGDATPTTAHAGVASIDFTAAETAGHYRVSSDGTNITLEHSADGSTGWAAVTGATRAVVGADNQTISGGGITVTLSGTAATEFGSAVNTASFEVTAAYEPAVSATTGNASATGTYTGSADGTLSVRYNGTDFQYSTNGSTWSALSGSAAAIGITFDTSGISNQQDGDVWTIAATAEVTTTTGGLLSVADAEGTLASIDAAVGQLADVLGDIGAAQNRIEYASDNVRTAIQNFTAAESVIRDVDMAEEMTKFSKNNILAQAGTAMLAQANQTAQGVLQLLRG